jgi:AraC-like DNA-binding protein
MPGGKFDGQGPDPGDAVFELIYGAEHVEQEMRFSEEHKGPFLGIYFNLGDEFDFTVPDVNNKVVKFYKNHFTVAYLPDKSATFHLKKGAYASLTFNVIPLLPKLWLHQFSFLDKLVESIEERVPFYLSNKPFFATDDMLEKIRMLLNDRHRGKKRDMQFYFMSVEIIVACLEHIAALRKRKPPKPVALFSPDKIVEHVMRYIKDHLKTALTLNQIAGESGMEGKALARVFRRTCGQTIRQAVFNERMKTALQLLQCTTMTIAQIAGEVGYTYHTHFTKAFKRKYNRFPSEMRVKEMGLGIRR